eukprot:jgi/Phyca11/107680/e_gw1.14.805.1
MLEIWRFRIYFAVLGFATKGTPGGNQYIRFLKLLNRVLDANGMTTNDFGTHSARNGATTYVSSCFTSGSSAAAICLRAGWAWPDVQGKYVRFEEAGALVVNRYVAGLPFDPPKFAILPLFFVPIRADENGN